MSQGLGDRPWCAGNHFSLADIAVGCALGYLDFRFPEIDWRRDYPNLTKLADGKLAQRSAALVRAAQEWRASFDAIGDPMAILKGGGCEVVRANAAFAGGVLVDAHARLTCPRPGSA